MVEKNLITIKVAAQELKLSEQTIRNMVDNGKIAGTRIPDGPRLVDRDDLKRVKQERKNSQEK